ncbi:MAG: DUF2269 domain-containing protein [Hyphomicrobiaceae bacterium]|nr:DUF2269 domain-containing protein [Hyphomicrobiaceae bacterium]
MSHLFLKWVHVVSATILFGTGIGTAFYMLMANRRGNVLEIYSAARTAVLADYIFTAPAVVVQLATGLLLVQNLGYSLSDPWILLSLALYFFAGACWLPVVVLQIKMRDIAKTALEAGEPLPGHFQTLDRWWIALGALAFPAILAVLYLMVVKPIVWQP